MSRFLTDPNLPKSCSTLIYGEKYALKLQKCLNSMYIESILLPDNPDVDPRLSGHADLSVLHAGGECLFLAPYLEGRGFARRLQTLGTDLFYPKIQQGRDYPRDAQLNICVIGKQILVNPKTASAEIVEYLTSLKGFRVILCRQGYSRCAVCVLDENSIMTEDRGVAAAVAAQGIQVLLLHPGFIGLDGFSHGFIGGATFKLRADTLAFTGNLDHHPDRDMILRFLAQRGISPVFLTPEPAFDIGSAVPISEN